MIIDEAPIVPLYYDKVMRFSKKNVFGLKTNPVNQLNLKKVYKKWLLFKFGISVFELVNSSSSIDKFSLTSVKRMGSSWDFKLN